MLTRPLRRQRVRDGMLRPLFVDARSGPLLTLGASLISVLEEGVGESRAAVEERLGSMAGAARQPLVARGLVKLLLDRTTFEPADPGAVDRRRTWLELAHRVRCGLPEGAGAADFERALEAALPEPLSRVRETMFSDLPAVRRLLGFKPLTPEALLDRYNLALAQAPLLDAQRLTVTAPAPSLLEVRKLLRWLRFCRLLAEVRHVEDRWVLEVEGPGAVVGMHKKYGLQLANFLAGIPILERWRLEAPLVSRGRTVTLTLDQDDPLVSPLPNAQGWLPGTLRTLSEELADDPDWSLELLPMPRPSGRGLCVPDLTLKQRRGSREIAVELFHRWHAGVLTRRLEALAERADPDLILGVERSLVRNAATKALLEGREDVFLFNEYPTARKLRALLPPFG
ncbi:MAG TPA: DUF790 family protein [Myxococcaceae bacterium]|nr:DUF790 family protein [Myxococcaceae bacterium]